MLSTFSEDRRIIRKPFRVEFIIPNFNLSTHNFWLKNEGNSDFKIGQKYPTPAPANGDRVFYESLLVQVPSR